MDYGKFKYREAKKQHEAKLKLKQIQVKEVKFRPGTDEGDYKIKLRNLIRFLGEGDKAKVTLRFRGREMAHQEFGVRLLERIRNDLEPHGVVEQFPRLEGRQMVMLLAPKKTWSAEAASPDKPEAGQPKAQKPLRSRRAPPWAANKGTSSHAEDEDQERREEALPRARKRQRSSARRRSSATSSPRSRPRTSGSCAAPPSVHSDERGFGQSHAAVRVRERTMPRVKRGVTARARHKKVLDAGQGLSRPPQQRLSHRQGSGDEGGPVRSIATAGKKKREFRALWIARINAAVRELGMTYSVFMNGLKKAAIDIDRKVLADLAVHDKAAFTKIAEQAKASLA